MGEIIKNTSLEDLYVPGNPSDESNCIGAAYYYNHMIGQKNEPIKSLYLGPIPEDNVNVIEDARKKYQVIKHPSNSLIIDELKEDRIEALKDLFITYTGDSAIHFVVYELKERLKLNMPSRKQKVKICRELLDELKEHPLKYKVN